MKKIKNAILLIALFLTTITVAQAQTTFTLNFGASMPTGKFADSNMDPDRPDWALLGESKNCGAGFGLNVGLQWNFGIKNVEGLSILLSADGILNFLNSDVKDYFDAVREELEDNNDGVDYSLATPKYVNAPLMVGINYTYSLNDKIGFFGEAAMGLNLLKITNLSMVNEERNHTYAFTYEYDLKTTFAYRLGMGLVFNNHYTLGVSFWDLGNAKIKVNMSRSVDGRIQEKESARTKELNPTMAMLRFGVKF